MIEAIRFWMIITTVTFIRFWMIEAIRFWIITDNNCYIHPFLDDQSLPIMYAYAQHPQMDDYFHPILDDYIYVSRSIGDWFK